jgi:hypothetical protein
MATLDPTKVTTGGPLPPMLGSSTPTAHTGGPLPPQPVTTPPPTTPNSSPIQIEDWRTSMMAQGNTNPQTQTVQGNQLVANQLDNLTASDSPYIQQARDHAMEAASTRGMMMSTMAAGSSQRAAIDAALPIAQQDAQRYGSVADQNMAATNQDRLADQGMYGQLLGQEMGIRANLDESERARNFTSAQNTLQRAFETNERLSTEQWQGAQQALQNAWQGAQNNAQLKNQLTIAEKQLASDQALKIMEMNFQGSQLDKQLLAQRFSEFDQSMQNENKMLADTIASIYSNPNLNSSQQAAAVANARATYQSLYTSYAKALSGGVPTIFWNPYEMSGQVSGGTTGVPSINTGGSLPPMGGTGGTGGTGTPLINRPGGGLFGGTSRQ